MSSILFQILSLLSPGGSELNALQYWAEYWVELQQSL